MVNLPHQREIKRKNRSSLFSISIPDAEIGKNNEKRERERDRERRRERAFKEREPRSGDSKEASPSLLLLQWR